MENLTYPLRLLLLSFCCCELLYEQNAKDMFAFSSKQVLVCFFFSQGFTVYLGQGSFLCLKCLDSFAKLHNNLKDNNRKSKVFLTGRLVSLVLVSQTVTFVVFVSASG